MSTQEFVSYYTISKPKQLQQTWKVLGPKYFNELSRKINYSKIAQVTKKQLKSEILPRFIN